MGCTASTDATAPTDLSLFQLWRCSACDSVQFARATAISRITERTEDISRRYSICRQCGGICRQNVRAIVWRCRLCLLEQASVSRPLSCFGCQADNTCFPPFVSGGQLFLPLGSAVPRDGAALPNGGGLDGGLFRQSPASTGRSWWWCEACGVSQYLIDGDPQCCHCKRHLCSHGGEAIRWRCPHCLIAVLSVSRPRSCPRPGCRAYAGDAARDGGGVGDGGGGGRQGRTTAAAPFVSIGPACGSQAQAHSARNIALEQSVEAIRNLAATLGYDRHSVRLALGSPSSAIPVPQPPQDGNGAHGGKLGEQNEPGSVGCVSPQKGRESEGTGDTIEEDLEAALESVSCPICLEVYQSPMAMPCGHSVCAHHALKLKGRCPLCRSPFRGSALRTTSKSAALTKNVQVVMKLASLAGPDQDFLQDSVTDAVLRAH